MCGVLASRTQALTSIAQVENLSLAAWKGLEES